MSQLPNHYTMRPPTPDDAAVVAELYNMRAVADGGQPDMTAERVALEWQRESFDLARHAWLVLAPDGRLAGYEEVMQEATDAPMRLDGCVHPEHTGRGIGAYLLSVAEEQAWAIGGSGRKGARLVAEVTVPGADDCARRLMHAAGYEPARAYSRMQVDMPALPPSPVWPPGLSIQPFVAGRDEQAMYRIMTDTFADVWGYVKPTFEQWRVGRFEGAEYDPSLWLFAVDRSGSGVAPPQAEEHAPVGAIIGEPRLDGGWVRGLGVRREYRGRGLGLALLQHMFTEFYRRGKHNVGLGVDSQSLTGAHRLYERAGMRVVERFVMYRKELKTMPEEGA